MATLKHSLNQALQSSVSKTNETENGALSPSKPVRNISTVLEILKTVDEVSRPISPKRAGTLAVELISLGLTKEQIELGCKRYAMSIASQFREIYLSDFTNPTIMSEMELREKEKELLEREKALQKRIDAFEQEVNRKAELKLNDITIELGKIASLYPSQTVIAARALYEAVLIIEAKKRKEIEDQIPLMQETVKKAYEQVKQTLNLP